MQSRTTLVGDVYHQIWSIINNSANTFLEHLQKRLPPTRSVSHAIPTVDKSVPLVKLLYRLSPLQREEVVNMLPALLVHGFIVPLTSPYASPILFVRKKEGTLRMVMNYRGITKLSVQNQYSLPEIDNLQDIS